MKNKEKKIIAILIMLLLIVIATFTIFYMKKDNRTAILDTSQTKLQNVDETGGLRIIMNSTITIDDNDTMQNLNFENANKNRLLKCKIKLVDTDKYVYESQFLETGKVIKADLLDGKVEKGNHEAIAEIHSYSLDKKKIGQTNVKITLNR